MKRRILSATANIKIAIAVTMVASFLQAIYHPSQETLYGEMSKDLKAFLYFGLIKVTGLGVASLLFARQITSEISLNNSQKKADKFLLGMISSCFLLAVYLFVSMRFIQSDEFVSYFSSAYSQPIGILTILMIMLAFMAPYYRRQYYDIAVIINADKAELSNIKENKKMNGQFVNTLMRKMAVFFLPLFIVHAIVVKKFLGNHLTVFPSIIDGFITCALALAMGYAIAEAHREITEQTRKAEAN